MPSRTVSAILETTLYAADLDAAAHFYESVLALNVFARVPHRHVFFRCGRGMLLIFNPVSTQLPSNDVPTHGAFGPGHVAFAIRNDEIDGWRSTLEQYAVPIESEVVWPGGGRSIYFRDPAGNSLELTSPSIWSIPESGELETVSK